MLASIAACNLKAMAGLTTTLLCTKKEQGNTMFSVSIIVVAFLAVAIEVKSLIHQS
jgi:hypothetical protein